MKAQTVRGGPSALGLYYLQDARTMAGNTILWWKKDTGKGHCGYVTDLDEAHVFTQAQIDRGITDRETDVAWPVELIEEYARRTSDFQPLYRIAETQAVQHEAR